MSLNEIIYHDAASLSAKITSKEVSSTEVTKAYLDQILATDKCFNSFLHVAYDSALEEAARIDDLIKTKSSLPSALAGVPIALKDVFTIIGMPTTAGSRMLKNWNAPYDSTIVTKLRAAGIPILGKTNMDEFAMGSSTENSAYGPTRNPWNIKKVPGGSGGGSASALASYQTPLAIGTDTGGSIRQPAALTSTVGVKPTYGTISRYGLVACASSLDQGGPCARTVLDAALLHNIISGYDPYDSTSLNVNSPNVVKAAQVGTLGDLNGVKIGLVKQLYNEGCQYGVLDSFAFVLKQLKNLGAKIVEVDCPHFHNAIHAYYLILSSEVSSNLARFDGMQFGLRIGDNGMHNAEYVVSLTRDIGFGPEVKRRILIGTYSLSKGYYDAYYRQANLVRKLIAFDFEKAYNHVDVLITPTTPNTAFTLEEKIENPLSMYLCDLYTLPLNLAGHCGMSLPCGISTQDGLPVGLQIMAPRLADDRLYRVGAAYEVIRETL